MNRRSFTGILLGGTAIPVLGDSSFAAVRFIEEEKFTTPVVTVDVDAPFADRVIVQTFYHTTAPFAAGNVELILAKTSIIPYVQNAAVACDPVPVKRDKIAWIVLTLVRDVAEMKWKP